MSDDPSSGDDGDGLDVPQWVAAGSRRPDGGRGRRAGPSAEAGADRSTGRRASGPPTREAAVDQRPSPPGAAGHALADDPDDDGYGAFLDFEGADGRDYVRLPRRPGVLRRMVFGAGLVVVLGVIAVTAAGWWVLRQIDPPGPPGDAVTVTIEEGQSAAEIAELLDEAGVVSNGRLFREYLRFRGAGDRAFQAGPYAFSRSSSMSEALSVLEQGPGAAAVFALTIPEGLHLDQIAEVMAGVSWFSPEDIAQALHGNVVRSPFQPAEVTTLEGLVFPDTYEVAEGSAPLDAVRLAVEQLGTVAAELGLEQRAAELGYSPYQVLTIASLIEREARVPEDRAKIARVIYNRIEADMRLDIDATVLYALGRTTGPLTETDLQFDSPYNTRLYPGLPPTPIAAPGRASIEAALHPEPGDWLYYVLTDEAGRHYFTADYDDFLGAIEDAYDRGLVQG